MSTYLKNMAGYKHSQLKNKSFKDIQMLFYKEMKRVDTFVPIDSEMVEKSKKVKAEGSSKRSGDELEQESSKKQKADEAEEVDDTAKMEKLTKIIHDEKIAIDVIHLASKPSCIRGLETLWKLVKAKHGTTRLEEGYDIVLYGDLKTMFEHHLEDTLWRSQHTSQVSEWKLFSSCGVHVLRLEGTYIYMLVEKRYPLTPAIITEMMNKKLQADYFNEMTYQLLKLMLKQKKNK
nr:hypothetical protein [Tanacetum cinerariifolium]